MKLSSSTSIYIKFEGSSQTYSKQPWPVRLFWKHPWGFRIPKPLHNPPTAAPSLEGGSECPLQTRKQGEQVGLFLQVRWWSASWHQNWTTAHCHLHKLLLLPRRRCCLDILRMLGRSFSQLSRTSCAIVLSFHKVLCTKYALQVSAASRHSPLPNENLGWRVLEDNLTNWMGATCNLFNDWIDKLIYILVLWNYRFHFPRYRWGTALSTAKTAFCLWKPAAKSTHLRRWSTLHKSWSDFFSWAWWKFE